MTTPLVYVDFQNSDRLGRLRLNCAGSAEDLARQETRLSEGMRLALYSDDLDAQGHEDELRVDGVATFSAEEQCWVAVIDWTSVHHASDEPDGNGAGPRAHSASAGSAKG